MFSLYRNNKLDLKFVLIATFLVAASIFPARKFFFTYAWAFKAYYFSLIIFATTCFFKLKRTTFSPKLLLGMTVFLFGLSLSVFCSKFPVRAGSELDTLLASLSIAYLLYWRVDNEFLTIARLIGVAFFLLLFFSLLTYIANDPPFRYLYDWDQIWTKTIGEPGRLLEIFQKERPNEYPFEYSNFVGLFGVIVVPFFVGMLLYEVSGQWQIFWFFATLLGLIEIKTGDSQSAYFALFLVIGLASVMYFKTKLRCSIKRGLLLMGSAFVLVVAIILLKQDLRDTLGRFFSGGLRAGLGIRCDLAKSGWFLFKESPWVGHGVNTTPFLYLQTLPETSFPSWQLHVTPMQYLVDWGIVGFWGLLLIFMTSCFMWWRLFFYTQSKDKVLASACLLSFIGYASFLTDWSLDIFGICASLTLIVFTLWHLYQKHFPAIENTHVFFLRSFKAIVLILFFTTAFYGIQDIRSRHFFHQGISAIPLRKIEKHVKKALEIDPSNYYFLNQLGNIFAYEGQNFPPAREKAVRYFEKSLKINPFQTYAHENLGALYTSLGDFKSAHEHYMKAITFAPSISLAYVQLVHNLLVNGFHDLAVQWISFGSFANPSLLCYAPFNQWLQANLSAQSVLFDLYNQAEEFHVLSSEKEKVRCEKLLMHMLLNKADTLRDLQTLRKNKALKNLFETYNLKNDFSLERVNRAMTFPYRSYSPFAYPEEIVRQVAEKVMMHNVEGPVLSVYTPCTLYWNPKLMNCRKILMGLRYKANKTYLVRKTVAILKENPFVK